MAPNVLEIELRIPKQSVDAELTVLDVDRVSRVATCRLGFPFRVEVLPEVLGGPSRYECEAAADVEYDEHGDLIDRSSRWPRGLADLLPATLDEAESHRVVGSPIRGRLTIEFDQ